MRLKLNKAKQEINELKQFLLLWFGQSLSRISTAMTSFAISIWVFQETGNALAFSVSALAFLLPDMVVGVFAGPMIDRWNKKFVIVAADIGTGLCILTFFMLLRGGVLEIWHVFFINLTIGILSSFQSPASEVALTSLVPKRHYVRASGLKSFSYGSADIIAPILAAIFMNVWGIEGVLLLDVGIMVFACLTLVVFVTIPKSKVEQSALRIKVYLREIQQGFAIVHRSKLLVRLLVFFAFINFVAGVTYFNLLTPMLLMRSGESLTLVSLVKSSMGIGIVVGGLVTVTFTTKKSKINLILLCTASSFLFGDILLSLVRQEMWWVIAGFFSSVFIPAITANTMYFWRRIIPIDLQGRAFAFRNAVGSGTIALGMLSGGLLSDYVFEPFMSTNRGLLTKILGEGAGAGMALLFLLTGISGILVCLIGFWGWKMQRCEEELDR